MKKVILSFLVLAMVLSLSVQFFADTGKNVEPSDSYTPVAAEYEDSGLSLSFSHSFVKKEESDYSFKGSDSYTIRMSKNEIEGCQFFLSSETARTGLTAEISPFKNENGKEIEASLYKEYYTPIKVNNQNASYPDAIPPLTDTFDITEKKLNAFLIKAITKEDTEAGDYQATLVIKDSQGREIKKATVFLKVWDFILSEKTECASAVFLDINLISNAHSDSGISKQDLYKIYYDYLLENRVCAFSLPYDIDTTDDETLEAIKSYMNNPRVTSFKIGDYKYKGNPYGDSKLAKLYKRFFADNPELLDKAYFYTVDEPLNTSMIEQIKTDSEKILAKFPGAQIVVPIHEPVQYNDSMDGIEYVKDYMGIWCSKPYAYTPRDLVGTIPNARSLQTEAQDKKFGTYAERMTAQKDAGKKVWWYVAWDPSDPYGNVLIENPGISHRILFWQQKQNDVEGFLYYYANSWFNNDYWNDTCTDPSLPYKVYGDGILIYDGSELGINGPVGSLRLEALRDGIEDYQYLSMLEELTDKETVDAMIANVSTNTAEWSKDDDLFVQTRIALGDAVEEAVKKSNECPDGEHQGGEANCTDKAVCEICGTEYGELDPLNHNNVDGVCTRCERRPGDVNNDGVIDESDVIRLLRYVSGVWKNVEVDESRADVNNDGTVDETDSIRLTRYYSGVWNGVTLE